ncbi:hypothetical protein LTR29_015346 [Friedmanniomyces endolithicus]|nr:hypothetical protein LTR29_015346 [Friedmanniomyces endolithicus]
MSPASDDAPTMEDLSRTFSVFTNPAETTSTVILGAGIIGCATAYYLSRSGTTKPDTIHLVEASPELFASASGKAAGFLASDWFGPPTASLGALSFRLHKKLAEANNGKEEWGYSRSTGASLAEGRQKNRGAQGGDSDWLSEGGSRAQTAARHEFVGDKIGPAWLTRREGDEVEMKWRRSAQTTV